MKTTARFFYEHNGGKIFTDELPRGTYFLSGFQREEERGQAFTMVFNSDTGTTLTPVMETATGEPYTDEEQAGKELFKMDGYQLKPVEELT